MFRMKQMFWEQERKQLVSAKPNLEVDSWVYTCSTLVVKEANGKSEGPFCVSRMLDWRIVDVPTIFQLILQVDTLFRSCHLYHLLCCFKRVRSGFIRRKWSKSNGGIACSLWISHQFKVVLTDVYHCASYTSICPLPLLPLSCRLEYNELICCLSHLSSSISSSSTKSIFSKSNYLKFH